MNIHSTAATLAAAILLQLCVAFPAPAQVSVGIGVNLPGVSIGINLPAYPDLAPIPGYPVYYAPGVNANFFFYDGLYWSFVGDAWYSSAWYNGPWNTVGPTAVPVFLLRVPVRYYRRPPAFFRGWRVDAAPRWGDHWGPKWQKRRSGWDRVDMRNAPKRAPLPAYQRQYSGDRYPRVDQQRALRAQYKYQPQDPYVKQRFSSRGQREQDSRGGQARSPQSRASQKQQQRRP